MLLPGLRKKECFCPKSLRGENVNKSSKVFFLIFVLQGVMFVGLSGVGVAEETDLSFQPSSVIELNSAEPKLEKFKSFPGHLKSFDIASSKGFPSERGIVVEEKGVPKKGGTTNFSGKRWGVVIGINNYQHVSPLKYAVNDARAVGSKLKNLGFDEVISLENEEATKSGIEGALNGLANDVGLNDTVVVFFAGHGNTLEMPNGSRLGYWVPVDGDVEQVIATGISMETIRLLSQVIPAKYLLYLIDACYSGLALRQTWPGDGDRGFVRQIITAGRSGEEVVEIEGHGIFTSLLLRAFDGVADLNRDGRMTVSELGVFLQSEVSHKSNREQNPLFGRWAGEEELIFQVPHLDAELAISESIPKLTATEPQRTIKKDNSSARVLVMIPETLNNVPVRSPRAESIIMQKLIESGMVVIDQEQIDEIRNPDQIKKFLQSGTRKQARWLGKQFGAEMVVIGEAIGQTFNSNIAGGRFISTDVQLQAKVISVKTGNVLDAYSVEGKGIGKSPLISGKKGFEKAGKQMSELILNKSKSLLR